MFAYFSNSGTIISQFLWISCQDFSFLISVSLALINGNVRPLCTVRLLLCFPQNSYPSSKITICQRSSQDMHHYDTMCNTCNWPKSLCLARFLACLFVCFCFWANGNWICFLICPFPLRGYSRIEEMRKCESHDDCLHPWKQKQREGRKEEKENKERKKEKKPRKYSRWFTKLNTCIYQWPISWPKHLCPGLNASIV